MGSEPSFWAMMRTKHRVIRSRQPRRRNVGFNRQPKLEKCEDRRMLAPIVVNSFLDNGDGANTTLREAVAQANLNPDVDTINFASTLNNTTITLTQGTLSITNSVTIDGRDSLGVSRNITISAGGGTNPTVGNGDGFSIVEIFGGDVEINSLKLTGGDTPISYLGGAINAFDTNLTISNSTITGNATTGNGGGIRFYSQSGEQTLNIISSGITDNQSGSDGGGIHIRAPQSIINIQSSVITGNKALPSTGSRANAGGIFSYAPQFTLASSQVNDNRAVKDPAYYTYGGGAFLYSNGGLVTITNTTISGNKSLGIEANVGGLAVKASNHSNVVIDHVDISDNHGDDDIGGLLIINDASTATVKNSTISGNTASHNSFYQAAAGVWLETENGGATSLEYSTVSGNYMIVGPDSSDNVPGGGVFVQNEANTTTVIRNCTISGNQATGSGGGIRVCPTGEFQSGGQLLIQHCTITNNRADSNNDSDGTGGGIDVAGSDTAVTIEDTIVAGNFGTAAIRDDIHGVVTVAWSLIGDNTGATITQVSGTVNQIGNGTIAIDPHLGPLADNGGPTQTHALLAGSPAIDAGNPAEVAGVGSVPLHDQRGVGFTRVFNIPDINDPGAIVDIGAYEMQMPKSNRCGARR